MTDLTHTQANAMGSGGPTRKESVGFSPGRVLIVALNTFVEAIRQKVYNVLLVIALGIIALGPFFRQFNLEGAQLKMVQDICLGAITVLGLVIAIVGTAQLLPREVENRTIYTILAKPVRRFEFLLGKYVGSVLLIILTMVVMTLMSTVVLVVVEQSLVAQTVRAAGGADSETLQHSIGVLRAQAYNPDLIKCLVLIFIELLLLAAITLFFSTFSTSMVFNVVMAGLVYMGGYLRSAAAEFWGDKRILMWLLEVVPDLSIFNVADDVVLGNPISWAHTMEGVLYGLMRTAIFLVAAYLIFTRKEI